MSNIDYKDVVRLMPTDVLQSVTAGNSTVDMYKFAIGSNELAFRERLHKAAVRVGLRTWKHVVPEKWREILTEMDNV